MPLPKGRDLVRTRDQLLAWLQTRLPDAKDLRLEELRGPEDTGFSSDTLLIDLDYRDETGRAVRRAMVVGLRPVGPFGIFPEYDVELQHDMTHALADTAVPVPRMYWLEPDPAPLGAPCYVMERLEGRVPGDNPPHHAEGWIRDLSFADRENLWWSGLDAMAEVHRLGPTDAAFDLLPGPPRDVSPIQTQLDYWDGYIAWGLDRSRYPLIGQALTWLRAHAPASEPVGICWGDARISNQIFQHCEVVGVIDWEMAFAGSPVADLAWYITLDRVFTEGIGVQRLAGFPDRAATIARWEQRVGRRAEHYAYCEVFAAWRFACILARIFMQMKFYEILPQDASLDVENFTTPILRSLLAEAGA
jgi:aminoglycoside phosphotransferase (APT) family kinase protein